MARLTFLGLIQFADDEGVGRGESEFLWGQLHSNCSPNVKRMWSGVLSELKQVRDHKGPLVVFYKVAGAAYYWLPGFSRQQYIEKPSKSKFPPPPNSGNGRGGVGPGTRIKDQGREKGEEEGGKPPEPPPALQVVGTSGEPAPTGPDLTLLAPVQAAADANAGNGNSAHEDEDQGPPERADDVLRQLLQKADRLTQMPNKRQTLVKYLQAARLRHGAAEVEAWLMDPANRGADVLAMQQSMDEAKRKKDRLF